MTTAITVRTHDRPATVRQIIPAAFDGEFETACRQAMATTVAPDSQMDFYVYDGVSLLIEEGDIAETEE